jgi:hypothetical protein
VSPFLTSSRRGGHQTERGGLAFKGIATEVFKQAGLLDAFAITADRADRFFEVAPHTDTYHARPSLFFLLIFEGS